MLLLWWKKRTFNQKCIIIGTIITICLLSLYLGIIFMRANRERKSSSLYAARDRSRIPRLRRNTPQAELFELISFSNDSQRMNETALAGNLLADIPVANDIGETEMRISNETEGISTSFPEALWEGRNGSESQEFSTQTEMGCRCVNQEICKCNLSSLCDFNSTDSNCVRKTHANIKTETLVIRTTPFTTPNVDQTVGSTLGNIESSTLDGQSTLLPFIELLRSTSLGKHFSGLDCGMNCNISTERIVDEQKLGEPTSAIKMNTDSSIYEMSEYLEYENKSVEILHISNASLTEEDFTFESNKTVYDIWSDFMNSTNSEPFTIVVQNSTSVSVTADTVPILNPVNGTDSTNMKIQFNRIVQSPPSEPTDNDSLFSSTINWQNETQNLVTESVRAGDSSFVTQNLTSKEKVTLWITITEGAEVASTPITKERVPLEMSRNSNPTNRTVSDDYFLDVEVDTTLSPDSEVETLKGFSFKKNLTTKPYEKTDNITQWSIDLKNWTSSYTEEDSTRENRLEADSGNQTKEICLDEACVLSAADFFTNANFSADPCENFYEFACGKYISENVLRTGSRRTQINQFTKLVESQIHRSSLLLAEPVSSNDILAVRRAKNFYKLCTDAESENELSFVKKLIHNIGGWPLLTGTWSNGSFSWVGYVSKFYKSGVIPDEFLSIEVEPYEGVNRLLFSFPKLSLPEEILCQGRNSNVVDMYWNFMVRVATLLGADKHTAERELSLVLEMEIKMAKIVQKEKQLSRNGSTPRRILQINEAMNEMPNLPWSILTGNLFEGIHISEDEIIIIESASFIHELQDMLRDVPEMVLANYVAWRAIAKNALILSEQISKIFHDAFYKVTDVFQHYDMYSGAVISVENRPRWLECIKETQKLFSLAVNHLYTKRYLDEDAKNISIEIASTIKNTLKDTINKFNLMDDTTRDLAKAKIDAVTICVSYPEKLLNTSLVNEYYSKIPDEQLIFQDMYLWMNQFEIHEYYSRLNKSVEECDSLMPLSNFATSHVDKNKLFLHGGILQGVFFSNKRPLYMNYGGIGFNIADILIRNIGIRSGQNKKPSGDKKFGDTYFVLSVCSNSFINITHLITTWFLMRQPNNIYPDWWTNETINNYSEKLKCYQKEDQTEQSIRMINEIATDNAAIKLAYDAYGKWARIHGPEKHLPGLQNLTPEQVFWLNFGSSMCAKDIVNNLTIERIRLINAITNQEDFARDFTCAKTAEMNRSRKCRFWT